MFQRFRSIKPNNKTSSSPISNRGKAKQNKPEKPYMMVGFDVKNKQAVDPKFICHVCSLILRDPLRLNSCGHRICQSCFGTEVKIQAKCPLCLIDVQPTQVTLDTGFKNDMQSLLKIKCLFCSWTDLLEIYQEHLDHVHQNPICELCDKRCNSVNELNEHKIFACQKMLINCPMKDFGCNESIIRGKTKEHYLTWQHVQILSKIAHALKSHSLHSKTTTESSRTANVTAMRQESHETSNIFKGSSQTKNDNGESLSNDSSQSQTNIKLSKEETCGPMQEVNHNQGSALLEGNGYNAQNVSDDGIFSLIIKNFQKKMTDAESGRQPSICSPPFHSSPHGYKMRLRLYPYGDGNARRTHMSLFLMLMRGEYDPILKFPFDYKVTFCLYDQSGSQRHIIDSFRPDVRSNSFQRPRSDMNIASGIPKFLPLATIQQEGNPYVRDDTMFVKVMVDFGDMPRTLLPYALSLNPGLPTHVQQLLIREEEKRRSQPKRS